MSRILQLILPPLKFLTEYRLFQRQEYPLTTLQIILWWEARRFFFNLIVGVAGLITIFVMLFSAMVAEKLVGEPIGWPDPPFVAIIGVILCGVGANVCYTGGWVGELLSREVWGDKAKNFAEISFTLGTVFSFFLTLLPGAIVTLAVLARVFFKTVS